LPTHPNYLKQKYEQLESILVEVDFSFRSAPYTKEEVVNCLQLLPSGFVKDIRYGLGLTKDYRFIISAIEEQTKFKSVWIGKEETGDDSELDFFHLNFNDFDEMRRNCDRITRRARQAAQITKTAAIYNQLAYRLGNEQRTLPTDNDAISKMLRLKLSDTDKQAAMSLVTEDKSTVNKTDSVT
jgi:hypothetical protein